MTETVPFKYKCDGCDRTIGDIGAFLWHHVGDKDYCPSCYDNLQDPIDAPEPTDQQIEDQIRDRERDDRRL